MTSVAKQDLLKQATKVTEALERANETNGELLRKTAQQAERIDDLKKVAEDQAGLIDAQTQAIYMAKEGEIDPEQIQEVVDNILKFGPDLYKTALAGGQQDPQSTSFGEVTETGEAVVEKTAQHPTYNGVEVTNPVERVLLDYRSKQYGAPGLQY